jgi:hypothetical protein
MQALFLNFLTSKAWAATALVLALLLGIGGIIVSERERRRRLIKEHVRTHREVSDEDFVREVGIDAAEAKGRFMCAAASQKRWECPR